ncbi:ArsR/SmtB family transcription factor [Dermacoccaceae bacterium W4C1]
MPDHEDASVVHPDVRALRAMSHPMRLQILGMLRRDGAATASGLAERLGLNSGATSYHLRQLAQAGLIAEDPERGSARDRWWQPAHQSTQTSLKDESDPEQRAATLAFVHAAVAQQVADIQRADAERDDLPPDWLHATTNSDWGLRLTAQRARDLVEKVQAVLMAAMEEEDEQSNTDAETFVVQLHAFPAPGRLANPQSEQDGHA